MREFLSYTEATAQFFDGDYDALDEAVLLHGLPMFIRLVDQPARLVTAPNHPLDDDACALLHTFKATTVRGWRRVPRNYAQDAVMRDTADIAYVYGPGSISDDGPYEVFVSRDDDERCSVSVHKVSLWSRTENIKLHIANLRAVVPADAADRWHRDAENHKPNWSLWLNLPLWRLDVAIILSCDIEPAWHVPPVNVHLVGDRKAMASAAYASGSLQLTVPPLGLRNEGLGDHLISPSDFRKWGETLAVPLEFPARFPAAESHSEPAMPAGSMSDKPLATRERNNLLRIIAALAKHGNIDVGEGGRGVAQIEAAVRLAGFDGPLEKKIGEVLAQIRGLD